MSDSYYELIDTDGRARREVQGDRPGAQHVVGRDPARRVRCRRCWCGRWSGASSATTPGCAGCVIDLLGGVPAEGDLWVRSQVERPGKQIELVSAEMLAQGPDGAAPAGRPGQRMAVADSRTPQRWCTHAGGRPLRPLSEAAAAT